eukprot:TRINITY_DN40281_c0_g1_i1.p1 TRINITY_DN40281_c0_g1~~TRINITY_DN40281_c0_g1_i1.p1  ORF type:complete len:246 (+),score=35.63 TRINITY_DN40281_c0_g1_i1:57-740(+)
MDSLYDALGVSVHASPDEIRQAYKRKVLVHHPDKGGSAESFRLLHLAFQTLSSPQSRKSYNDHVGLYKQDVKAKVPHRRKHPPSKRGYQPATFAQNPGPKTSPVKGLLGAGIPPKKRDSGGQRPRSFLLRSLRTLHRLLASQPEELRRESIDSLSPLLKEELAAFIAHQKARQGGQSRLCAGKTAAARSCQIWPGGEDGGGIAACRHRFPCARVPAEPAEACKGAES